MYGVTLIMKETYLDDSVSFDTIQCLQHITKQTYTFSLGINYYQTRHTCTPNHYGYTSVYKTDFVQIFVKFDYWYITV